MLCSSGLLSCASGSPPPSVTPQRRVWLVRGPCFLSVGKISRAALPAGALEKPRGGHLLRVDEHVPGVTKPIPDVGVVSDGDDGTAATAERETTRNITQVDIMASDARVTLYHAPYRWTSRASCSWHLFGGALFLPRGVPLLAMGCSVWLATFRSYPPGAIKLRDQCVRLSGSCEHRREQVSPSCHCYWSRCTCLNIELREACREEAWLPTGSRLPAVLYFFRSRATSALVAHRSIRT